jgi:hypothetical protein
MKKVITMCPEFKWMGVEGIKDACGVIAHWLWEAEVLEVRAEELIQHVLKVYGFPVSPMEGGSFVHGSTYQFPGDPDMRAMMTFVLNNGVVVHMYQYGMVAFFVRGNSSSPSDKVMYRLD